MTVWAEFEKNLDLKKITEQAYSKGLYFSDGSVHKYASFNKNATRLGFASSTTDNLSQSIDILTHAEKSKDINAKATALLSLAYWHLLLNEPGFTAKNALQGLKLLEKNNEDIQTKYKLNYLLYTVNSYYHNFQKMKFYIDECFKYAVQLNNPNMKANCFNSMYSIQLSKYKNDHHSKTLSSGFNYLLEAFEMYKENPQSVTGNTLAISCINIADYYLEYAKGDLASRKEKAYHYLAQAENMLKQNKASGEKWINILGIKSDFAVKENNLLLAENYLQNGLEKLNKTKGDFFKAEYRVNKKLSEISKKQKKHEDAFNYQNEAEKALSKSFKKEELFNLQKLEVQYQTDKKNQELAWFREKESLRKKENRLYAGLIAATIIGLVFICISYYFRLRYSVEREKKLQSEKNDVLENSMLQIKIEKEEQARLKAEQELLELKKNQLEKEALANSVIIEHNNKMLQKISDEIDLGESINFDLKKLIKEEMLAHTDFEHTRKQLQDLHPDFFNRLNRKKIQNLTPLDLKYCTFIYLKMSTNQIAQTLSVEPPSVRIFKYRLKQKFGLGKDLRLEDFLDSLG